MYKPKLWGHGAILQVAEMCSLQAQGAILRGRLSLSQNLPWFIFVFWSKPMVVQYKSSYYAFRFFLGAGGGHSIPQFQICLFHQGMKLSRPIWASRPIGPTRTSGGEPTHPIDPPSNIYPNEIYQLCHRPKLPSLCPVWGPNFVVTLLF